MDSAVINNAGQVAFLSINTNTFNDGVFFYNGTSIVTVASENTPAPGGGTLREFFVRTTDFERRRSSGVCPVGSFGGRRFL